MHLVNVYGPDDVRLDKVERPMPGERDAIVRIEACGVCGTDLTFIRTGGTAKEGSPMPLGHEAAGTVVAVGPKADGVKVGQHVIVNPMGTSAVIGNGGPEGAFTEELLVREAALGRSLLAVPEGLPSRFAALAEPLGVAMHGVNRSGAMAGEKVVVFGCGPIGLGAVLWLRHRGIEDVVAVDVFDERLEMACAMGARATIRADREDLATRLADLHGREDVMGRPAVGTHAYIDAAGAPGIVPDVVKMARKHARLVVIAAYRRPVELDLQAMLTSEMSITTSIGYPDELETVLTLLPTLTDKLDRLVTHRFPFERVIEAFGVAGKANAGKVMVEFGENR
ncbi:MAG: alcohol dehydrogenase catalytic domain-containing protein [Novosphingobium sp.]|nr:alcohol dehydrogenase catalytic domain-containing protein [Novosphingobium sp.]